MKTPIAFILTVLALVALISAPAIATPTLPEDGSPPTSSAAIRIIPAGTPIMIRTSSTLNTEMNLAGTQFPATLAADMVVDGEVVIPRGTFVQGRVIESVRAGRLGRTATLRIELTDISVGTQFIPIATDQQGSAGKENDTGTKTGAGAVIGGVLGGWSGIAKGAAIGLGVSAATKGKQVNIPTGTLLEFRLQQPVQLEVIN